MLSLKNEILVQNEQSNSFQDVKEKLKHASRTVKKVKKYHLLIFLTN